MSGFAVAAARLARPDPGLLSYAEMLDQGRGILEAVSIPVIGDDDYDRLLERYAPGDRAD
jgi:2-methylisocitrate lyase-like PEP mutase family enzyme